MNSSVPLSRLLAILLPLFAVVILVPLVALALYNHPSPTDDYCFADTSLRYGFWQAQQIYYNGWSGRYFHNFLVHSNPLVFDWYGGFKVYPVIFLTVMLLCFYALASQLVHRSFGTGIKLALASGLFIGFVVTIPGIAAYFYWYPGFATYGLSSVLFLLLLATLIAHQRQGYTWQSSYLLAETLLILVIVGSSEMAMVLVMSALCLLAFAEWLQRRRLSATTLLLLGIGAVACYFLLTAPGNAIRMGGNPNSSNIPLTLTSSLLYMGKYIIRQLVSTPWVPLSLLYLPVAWQLVRSQDSPGKAGVLPPYLRVHPLLATVYGLLTVMALISLHFYGVGVPPIPRLINVVNLTFWLSWLYTLTLWVALLRHRLLPSYWQTYARPVGLILFVWVVVAAAFGPMLPVVYGDWLSGRAAQYDREMLGRYALLDQSGDGTVVIAPLTHYPASLFIEDIHDNPEYLWNRCWANFFHKKTIILSGTQPPPTE